MYVRVEHNYLHKMRLAAHEVISSLPAPGTRSISIPGTGWSTVVMSSLASMPAPKSFIYCQRQMDFQQQYVFLGRNLPLMASDPSEPPLHSSCSL